MRFNLLSKFKTVELKGIIVSVFALITGNFVSTLVGLICTFVQGRYVTAETLGYYKQFTILSGYLFVFQLGTYQALERMVPYLYGKGDEKEARKYVAVAYAWSCLVSVLVAGIFVVLCVKSICVKDYKAALCWFSQIIVAVYTIVSGVLASTYRSLKDFQKLASANVVGSVATLLAIPVFVFNPLVGVILKSVLNSVAIVPLLMNCPIKVKPRFQMEQFKELIRQGVPIFSASYITGTGLDTLRNTLVLRFLNLEGLGLWNFAYMFYTMVIVIPNSLVAVISPRVIRDYGQSGSLKFLLKKYRRVALGLVVFATVLAIIGGGILINIVPWLLPNYTKSLPIMLALLPCFVIKVLDIFYTMLLAVNDMKGINIISVTASIVQLLSIVVAHAIFKTMYAFSIALFLGMFIKAILVMARLFFLGKEEK